MIQSTVNTNLEPRLHLAVADAANQQSRIEFLIDTAFSCNGTHVGEMTKIPDDGGLGLRAESGEFAFRNIRIKGL